MARCNESPPETDLKLSRLEWTDVDAHGNGTIPVQRLKDVVDEVARCDVICRSVVNTLFRITVPAVMRMVKPVNGIHRVHNAPPES